MLEAHDHVLFARLTQCKRLNFPLKSPTEQSLAVILVPALVLNYKSHKSSKIFHEEGAACTDDYRGDVQLLNQYLDIRA